MKWFKRSRAEAATPASETAPGCQHVVLLPHWDVPENMGQEKLATSFACQVCRAQFSPDEAQRLRATEAERLRT